VSARPVERLRMCADVSTDGEDRTWNNYDCQNFQQVFTVVPVHIKHVFMGIPKKFHVSKRSCRNSKDLSGKRIDLEIQIFWVWSPPWVGRCRSGCLKAYFCVFWRIYVCVCVCTCVCTCIYTCEYTYIDVSVYVRVCIGVCLTQNSSWEHGYQKFF